jgi:hypothetical protein
VKVESTSRLLPLRFGRIGRVEMNLLNVQRQEGEVGIVDIEHGPAGAVLEHVARLEILPVEARGFAVAAFTNSLVSGKQRFHQMSPSSGWD